MATLHAFGPELLRQPAAAPWWNEMFRQWASVLDLVVWLDCPDEVLQERINGRERWHLVKGRSEQEVSRFLDRHRKSYYHVLFGMSLHGGPGLIAFNAGRTSIEQMLRDILAACNSGRYRG
jgi:thymidylate kinase